MTVLDKAVPPLAPAFPIPLKVMALGIGAGLVLGLLLAMLAEALDRRVRFPIDLEYSASGPFLGHLEAVRRSRRDRGASALRPLSDAGPSSRSIERRNRFGPREPARYKTGNGLGNNSGVASLATPVSDTGGSTIEY